jgi:signal transduction histidine kinase
MPEQYGDPEFRARMSELVGADVRRIENVVSQLQELALDGSGAPEPVDLAHLVDTLLEEMRDEIQLRRLLVLRELDRNQPTAFADPLHLRTALGALFAKALERVREHGDVYVATRHHAAGLRGKPALRLLLRYQSEPGSGESQAAANQDLSTLGNALEFALAAASIESQGGTFALDTSRESETVVVIDLPAPP